LLERFEKTVPIDRDRRCEAVAWKRRTLGGADGERRYVIALQLNRGGFFHACGKWRVEFKRRPFLWILIELLLEHFVVKRVRPARTKLLFRAISSITAGELNSQ